MMKMLIKSILLILVLSACNSKSSLAQNGKAKAVEVYKKADEALVFGRYDEARDQFEEVLILDPNYLNAHFQLANLYQYYYKDYLKALYHNEAALKIKEDSYRTYYEASLCCLALGKYELARQYAEKYLKEGNLSASYKWEAELLLSNIDFSEKAILNKVPFELVNMGPSINSSKAEYFPSITADKEFLYFTVNDESGRYPNEDIYASQWVDGKWEMRKKVANVNSEESQEGAHSITQDGRYLFFASDRMQANVGKFDIYIAKKLGDDWKTPVNIGSSINTYNWESQPLISADSKSLFFVRKSKDGMGGSDIYVSVIGADGRFSEAQNIGAPINTPGDEQRPYMHPDGKTLYFASNGHPGMGKGDIYMSQLQDDGTWSKPVNLGYPINTFEDEFGLYVSADGTTGYISSDREGGYGDMDIYSFDLDPSIRPKLVFNVKGMVKDAKTALPLKADIKIIDIETGESYKTLSSDAVNGSFLITLPAGRNYAYQAVSPGYLPFSENFSLENYENRDNFHLEAVLKEMIKGEEFVLKNIFFDPDKFELKEASKAELNTLKSFLEENPSLFLEVGGHTDDAGSSSYNVELSEKRAKSVYDYLLSIGIPPSRLSYKGYGESSPLYPNDTEANKAKNRRTAFKVL